MDIKIEQMNEDEFKFYKATRFEKLKEIRYIYKKIKSGASLEEIVKNFEKEEDVLLAKFLLKFVEKGDTNK